jgi:hypothetical protein
MGFRRQNHDAVFDCSLEAHTDFILQICTQSKPNSVTAILSIP